MMTYGVAAGAAGSAFATGDHCRRVPYPIARAERSGKADPLPIPVQLKYHRLLGHDHRHHLSRSQHPHLPRDVPPRSLDLLLLKLHSRCQEGLGKIVSHDKPASGTLWSIHDQRPHISRYRMPSKVRHYFPLTSLGGGGRKATRSQSLFMSRCAPM